ncbi:hypothetical protein EV356DRAFT_508674 [Viridothelium virens]|uniref:Uncharacterized protein n=1 Tax=Viridothelium virens TaxID=1048519 RepID=A0A6A6HJB1_VIRVR|nr:hypothetical protein EV356DRAFT_508674 [Viridothelium virens]
MKSYLALGAVAIILTNVAAVPVTDASGTTLVKADFDLERREEHLHQKRGGQQQGGGQQGNNDNDDDDNPAITKIESQLNGAAESWANCIADPKNQKCNNGKNGQRKEKRDEDRGKRAPAKTPNLSARATRPTKKSADPFFIYE